MSYHLADELPLRERTVSMTIIGWASGGDPGERRWRRPGRKIPIPAILPTMAWLGLSVVQGNVSIRHGDLGELSPAALNVPLVTTDRVVTGDQAAPKSSSILTT